MTHLTGLPLIGQELYNQSATPLHRLGQLGLDEYGNKYRYAKAGGTALVTGNLLQEPAEDTQFVSMAVPAAVAIGETEITVTNGTTTVTDGMFNEGTLVISVTPGIGQQFRIVSHTTGTSGASITYTVDRPLKIALTTSSKVTVRKNAYNGVIQYPASTQTGGAVGVALYAMTASYYGWIQTGGDCVVTFDTGTNSANGASAIAPSAAVAGSVAPVLDAVGAIVIGFSRQVASVDSTCSIAHLQID
jgi:hypothetical protein